jgi:uncharacterized coiled-coil DUF342 family protein
LQNQAEFQIHEIDKSVTDQYILVYQIQQIRHHLQNISLSIQDRKKIVEALDTKGNFAQSEYQLLDIESSIRDNDYLQQTTALSDAACS